MSAAQDQPDQVWVHDYSTSSGVQVAGHWRRRRSLGGPGSDNHTPPPTSAYPETPPSPNIQEPAQTLVRAAQRRYSDALVAAGVSALRQRHGQPTDLPAALRERAAARAELAAAQQDTTPDGDTTSDVQAEGKDRQRCPDCGQYRAAQHTCPTPPGLPTGDYAGLKGEARVKAMVADLETSIQAIVDSGQLHRWLDAMASNGLSRWSANNRLLAAVQLLQRGESLDGIHLMGFRQWEKHHRRVNKGAKAVWILAPMTRRVIDDDGTETTRVVGFKAIPTFNISDTTGEPLPTLPATPPAGQATPGTLQGLRDRVTAAGYTYQETEIPGCRPATGDGTLGYTDPASRSIVIDARLSDAQKASTIAHELGHVHCGHVDDLAEYTRHRGQMETEAEMTAYLVNRARGMTRDQVHSFSPAYIASWSRGDTKIIHGALDKATRAFNTIIDGPWPKGA